jgi:uncharacterized protein (TIGR02246 family)
MANKMRKEVFKRPAGKMGKTVAKKPMSAAQAIQELDAEFMKAASAKDAAALVRAFYAPDAVLMPPNRPAVEGREQIQGFLQGLMDSGLTEIKLETTTTASGEALAYGRGRYTLSLAPPGGAPVRDVGKYVVVYRRQANGSWRAVADIFNSDQPASQAGASPA